MKIHQMLFSLPLLAIGLNGPVWAVPAPKPTPKPTATPKPLAVPTASPTPQPVATPTAAHTAVSNLAPLALSLQGVGALSWGGGWLPDPGLMLGVEYNWDPHFGLFAGAAGFLQSSGFSSYVPLSLRYHHPLSPAQTLFGGVGGFVVYAPGAGLVPGALLEVGSEYRLNPHWSLSLSLDTGLSFGSALAFTTGLRGGLNFRP